MARLGSFRSRTLPIDRWALLVHGVGNARSASLLNFKWLYFMCAIRAYRKSSSKMDDSQDRISDWASSDSLMIGGLILNSRCCYNLQTSMLYIRCSYTKGEWRKDAYWFSNIWKSMKFVAGTRAPLIILQDSCISEVISGEIYRQLLPLKSRHPVKLFHKHC